MKTDKTDKMKTKNEILNEVSTDTTTKGRVKWIDAEKAMQEHTDQAIAAYKLKLKEGVRQLYPYEAFEKETVELSQVEKLIDTTAI